MRETRRQASSAAGRTRQDGRSTLRVIRGGTDGAPVPAPRTARTASRRVLVERARARAAAGYYERPCVRERLVNCLWKELFSG